MSQKNAEPPLFVVFNPGSGSQDKEEVRRTIEEALGAAGREYRFVPVPGGDVRAACQEAARLAKESAGVLVAVGGDGTINTAAQAAYTHDCVLGVVAQGTFNMFARDHGLPLEAREAVELLLRAQPQDVQAGSANQQLFLVNASLGLYPKILADREEMKNKLGRKRWVAFIAAIKSLFAWRTRLAIDIELDGQSHRLSTSSLFVCNNRMQVERVGIAGDVVDALGQGRLAGVVARPLGAWAKVRLLVGAILGRLQAEPEIESFAMRSITVGTPRSRRMRVAVDGEVQWMESPVRIAVMPRPLRVLMPVPHGL